MADPGRLQVFSQEGGVISNVAFCTHLQAAACFSDCHSLALPRAEAPLAALSTLLPANRRTAEAPLEPETEPNPEHATGTAPCPALRPAAAAGPAALPVPCSSSAAAAATAAAVACACCFAWRASSFCCSSCRRCWWTAGACCLAFSSSTSAARDACSAHRLRTW